MTLVVPAVLLGLAFVVVAIVSISASRRQRTSASEPAYLPTILIHSINDDRCTGCDACVAVCPTNVLDLVANKSRVLRFQDCIQCEACMWACPTEALVMHKEGSEPPPLKVPELDDFYQTAVPGQYLIGEVAGKPLVKNAANLGRAVVEHMLSAGLRPGSRRGPGQVDVAIVGSGPGGLSAALTCINRGLSYVLLEKEQIIASTVARYPKGKLVMAEPYDSRNVSFLPVFDSSKEELVPLWRDLIERAGLRINMGEAVEEITNLEDGSFGIRTTVGKYQASRVILATGTRGKPRTLGVPGENLPKVVSLLDDPGEHRGKAVLVVGGGDSALEATIALADAGAKVILSYRGRSFSRAQPKLRSTVENYESQRRIKVNYQSVVTELDEGTVTLQMIDGTLKKYPNEAAFVLIGSEPPVKWLSKVGVRFVERPHSYALPKSDVLVERLLGPNAVDCPESASGAAALIAGQPVPVQESKPSSGRKWLRSATQLFGLGGKRMETPMPLSEFARHRHHTGTGRRDALPPSERTRMLRMLRDEGARLADEESSVELFRAPSGPPVWDEVERASSPPRLDDPPPKQAVIVGLAEAAARGPRGIRKRRTSPAPIADQGPFDEASTSPARPAHARGDTKELLNKLIQQDRATKRATGSPPPAAFSEDPTRVVDLDGARLMNQAEGRPRKAQPDEPTAMVDFEQMIAEEVGAPPADAVQLHDITEDTGLVFADESTRNVDVQQLLSSADPGNLSDEKTRQVDLGKDRLDSLSDVEFDLD